MKEQVRGAARSIVVVAAVAIACATGCVAAGEKANDDAVPKAAVEMKTFGEWVEVHKKEQQDAYKRHPQLPDIEKGSAFFLTALGRNPGLRGRYLNREGGSYTELGKRYFDAYTKFSSAPKTQKMIEKWKADGCLNEEDYDFKWLIQAICTDEHKMDIYKGEGKRIITLVNKAFRREMFTREEVDSMRAYFSGLGKATGWTSGTFIPYTSREINNILSKECLAMRPFPKGIRQGMLVPDIRAVYFDKIERDMDLTKKEKLDFNLHAMVTPLMLETLNVKVSMLKVIEKDGKRTYVADYSAFDKLPKDYVFSLYEELKKGKPIFLNGSKFTGSWDQITSRGAGTPHLRYLFENDVTVYSIQSFGVGGGAADYGHNKAIHNSELWEGGAFLGRNITSAYSGKRKSLDSLARQILEFGYMFMPTFSNQILVDSTGSDNFLYSISWGDLFVDTNGVQCNFMERLPRTRYNSTSGRQGTAFHTYVGTGLTPDVGYLYKKPAHVRDPILFLKIMESLDWKYDAENSLLQSYYRSSRTKTPALYPYQQFGWFTARDAVVRKIDKAKKELHVEGTVYKLKNAKSQLHILHYDDNLRIIQADKDGKRAVVKGSLDDVSVGDNVPVYWQLKSGTTDDKMLRCLSLDAKVSPIHFAQDLFWVAGMITALDTEADTCTIKMPKPDPEKGAWRGFKDWQSAHERFGTKLPAWTDEQLSETKKLYLTGKPMYYGDDSARTFNLVVDSAVEVSVNGLIRNDLAEAKVGDKALFTFSMTQLKNTHPTYYPWHLMVVTKDKMTEKEIRILK
jgi:hypothetical protein